MPKAGYVSLNVKEEDARRLEMYAQKNKLTMVAFAHLLAENLSDIDAQTLAKILRNAPTIKLKLTIKEEILKTHMTNLYHYIDAMHSIIVSLFPSPYVDLKIFRVLKPWEETILPYTALRTAGVVDPSVDALELEQKLASTLHSLRRILDKSWSDWGETKPPPLIKEIPLPKPLLKPDLIIKKEALETLKNEIKPFIEEIANICNKAEETLYTISADHPEILELCAQPIKIFKKFFKL
ncbi:MAG: hypothetical protein QXX79_07670 [Candidatus Bathyarchaeia archaeon]